MAAVWTRPLLHVLSPLRVLSLVSCWALAAWVSLVVGGMPRADETASSVGVLLRGLMVSLFYGGPFFVLVLVFFQRRPNTGVRLVVGTWLMTNVLANGMLAHEDAVVQRELSCEGKTVRRDRAWPFEGTTMLCNRGEWHAHD